MAKRIQKKYTTEELKSVIIEAVEEKKGSDITLINFKEIHSSIFDCFIVCNGLSRPQMEAITDSVIFSVKEKFGILPKHTEGLQNAEWILIDYFDVIVHIFNQEAREFYRLENLWADADIKTIKNNT